MTLIKNSLFKPKRTGTMFELANIDGSFKETGFYDLDYSDIELLIEKIRDNYITTKKELVDFHYLDYIQNKTTYDPFKYHTPAQDNTFVSPVYNGTYKAIDFFKNPKIFLKLNKEFSDGANINLNPILKVEFDYGRNTLYYLIEYRYSFEFLQDSLKSKMYAGLIKPSEFIAFTFTTTNLFAAKALCEDLTAGTIKNAVFAYASEILKVYKNINTNDSKRKKVYYENVPPYILQYFNTKRLISNKQLILDLVQLLNYDASSNFIDTSGALINILKGFGNGKYVYDFLYKNGQLVLLLYSYITSSSKREELCQFLTALASCYETPKAPSKYFNVKKGGKYQFDSSTFFESKSRVRLSYGYYSEEGGSTFERFGETVASGKV